MSLTAVLSTQSHSKVFATCYGIYIYFRFLWHHDHFWKSNTAVLPSIDCFVCFTNLVVWFCSRVQQEKFPLKGPITSQWCRRDLHDTAVNPIKPLLTTFHLPLPVKPLSWINHGSRESLCVTGWRGGPLRGNANFFLSCIQLSWVSKLYPTFHLT